VHFYNWWYRRRLWTIRYFQWRDMLPLLGTCLAIVLAVNSYSSYPILSIICGVSYLIVATSHFVLGLRARRALDYGRGEVVGTLFAFINQHVFGGDHRTRFTLFVPAPGKPEYIIPWYRYREGGNGPVDEARRSRARYRRDEGETGRAWAQAGRKVLCSSFPPFKTKQEFQTFYIDQMKVDADVARELSDYMVGVRTMFSYGCVGANHRILGVLSVDFQAELTETKADQKTKYSFPSPDGDDHVELDWDRLELLIKSVQNVLECFERADSAEIRF
jgi:hypothetical protein